MRDGIAPKRHDLGAQNVNGDDGNQPEPEAKLDVDDQLKPKDKQPKQDGDDGNDIDQPDNDNQRRHDNRSDVYNG